MSQVERPVVVVSSCLTGCRVRYDGQTVEEPFVEKLLKYLCFIPVCPEVEIGLGVPRKKVFLVRENNSYRLIQEETEKDLTERMERFSVKFLSGLPEVDGFILKASSPSCGVTGAKTYKNKNRTGYIGRRKGIFARQVLHFYKNYPVADEKLLKDRDFRFLFLNRLFLFFYYRVKGAEFVLNNFGSVLQVYSRKGFNRFIKNPDRKNFVKIFSKIEKSRINELKKHPVFPAELLQLI
ncbi:DUF523 domain-containing protein [Persephonella sp.]